MHPAHFCWLILGILSAGCTPPGGSGEADRATEHAAADARPAYKTTVAADADEAKPPPPLPTASATHPSDATQADATEPDATFRGLGVKNALVSDLSGDGSTIVGVIVTAADNHGVVSGDPFLWTEAEGIVRMNLPGKVIPFTPMALSADGSILVGTMVADRDSGAEGQPHAPANAQLNAFRWTRSGGLVPLGFLPGTDASRVADASADGSVIIGECSEGWFGVPKPFRWTAENGMTELAGVGGPELQNVVHASAVSADGAVVVGTVGDVSRPPPVEPGEGQDKGAQAFRWIERDGMVLLETLADAKSAIASDASANGKVIVGLAVTGPDLGPSTQLEAFHWSQETGTVGLGNLQGCILDAEAPPRVSADGALVVGTQRNLETSDHMPFVWDAAHGLRLLSEVLARGYGLERSLAGWKLYLVVAVSADGRTLVGYGVNPAGATDLWIARLDRNVLEVDSQAEASAEAASSEADAGPLSPEAAAVVTALKSPDDNVFHEAMRRLSGEDWAKVAPAAMAALKDPNLNVRERAAMILNATTVVDTKLAIPALIDALNDEYPVNLLAAEALGRYGPAAKAATPGLAEIVRFKDADFEKVVVWTDDERPKNVRQYIVNAWDSRFRMAAADALWRIDRQADILLPFLVEELKLSDSDRWMSAATLVGEIGPDAVAAVPVLVEVLQDKRERGAHGDRQTAAEVLGKIGATAREALPALVAARKETYDSGGMTLVASAAAESLNRIDPDGILQALGRGPMWRPLHHDGSVNAIAFSVDGKLFATASDKIRLWDVATGKERSPLVAKSSRGPTCLSFAPDGKTLAVAYHDFVILWKLTTGEAWKTLRVPEWGSDWAAFAPDGGFLAVASHESVGGDAIVLWDVENDKSRKSIKGHNRGYNQCIAFSPDGATLASGGNDSTVRLWDVATGQECAVLTTPYSVETIAWSHDGKLLASAGDYDSSITLWDLSTNEQRFSLRGHGDVKVHAVAFSPDSKKVASGGEDKTVRLWDVATGEELGRHRDHDGPILAVAISPDGKILASGGGIGDQTVRFWETASLEKHDAP